MSVFRTFFVILLGAALCVSCAVSPEIEEKRQALNAGIASILGEPSNDEVSGDPKRCLSDNEYRNFRALGEHHMLFEGRQGEMWVNTLRARCPDLRHGTVLRVKSHSSIRRLCKNDLFAVDDWFSLPWYRSWPWQWGGAWSRGMSCSLGMFQPVTETQVDAIEDLIRQN